MTNKNNQRKLREAVYGGLAGLTMLGMAASTGCVGLAGEMFRYSDDRKVQTIGAGFRYLDDKNELEKQREHDKNVARIISGQDRGGEMRREEIENPLIKTFNEWIDRDGNNSINFKTEVSGIKDIFKVDEQIALYFQYETKENVRDKKIILRIFGADGKMIGSNEIKSILDHCYTAYTTINPNSFKPGEITAEWYTENGERLGRKTIRIIE